LIQVLANFSTSRRFSSSSPDASYAPASASMIGGSEVLEQPACLVGAVLEVDDRDELSGSVRLESEDEREQGLGRFGWPGE
jgi:hypothetical protein